jgi:uncharacterized membrane protein YfcA
MRIVLGAIIGYITMNVVVITGNSLAGYIFHLDYHSASTPPGFLAMAIFFSFLAANIGGFVATALARGPDIRPAIALIALSIAMAVLTFFEAPAAQPKWYLLVLMAVMIVGVLLGAKLRIRSQALSGRLPDGIE